MSAKRTAFVTGGAGGIGSAICRELAQSGVRIFAGYHPAEEAAAKDKLKEWKAAGFKAEIVGGDVSDYESCVDMAKQTGPVDILVNCAGITRDARFRKMTKNQWDSVIAVNLNSVFYVTKQYIDGMTEKGFGRIVNISSINGKKGQFGQTNYAAAKAGIHGFTMSLAQEVAQKGVTVNTLSPGYTATAMTKAIAPVIAEQIAASIPVGRMGEPEEIAHAVAFLASDRAGFITGANLSVNGGQFISF